MTKEFHTVNVQFTDEHFSAFVDQIVNDLIDWADTSSDTDSLDELLFSQLKLTRVEIESHPLVIAMFQLACEEWVRDEMNEFHPEDMVNNDALRDIFHSQIDAYERDLDLKRAQEADAKEARRAAELEVSVQITVKGENAERARKLLEVAGLL